MVNLSSRLGTYIKSSVTGEHYNAFIPPPLPPEPPLDNTQFYQLFAQANQAIGRLNATVDILPNTNLLLYFYICHEAVLSSQIEGTQSSLSDLLLAESDEMPSVPLDDVEEVSNYIAALRHGLKRLRAGFPLSLRLIREIHQVLLAKGRGSTKMPGEFRQSQNWIGGSRPGNARFVPPPPERVMACLDNLEKFLHAEQSIYPTLLKAALIHVQFETIHPFLDGNGRVGRLLIILLSCTEGLLSTPALYLSLYFKNNRDQYYHQLNRVRETGDWESWVKFFLTGVIETADQVVKTTQAISQLFIEDHEKIKTLKRAAESAYLIHDYLKSKAIVTVPKAVNALKITPPTVRAALKHLCELNIVKQISGRDRRQIYVYSTMIKLLEQGVKPV